MTTSLSLSHVTGREQKRHEVKRRTRVKVDVDVYVGKDKEERVDKAKLGRETKLEESVVG